MNPQLLFFVFWLGGMCATVLFLWMEWEFTGRKLPEVFYVLPNRMALALLFFVFFWPFGIVAAAAFYRHRRKDHPLLSIGDVDTPSMEVLDVPDFEPLPVCMRCLMLCSHCRDTPSVPEAITEENEGCPHCRGIPGFTHCRKDNLPPKSS